MKENRVFALAMALIAVLTLWTAAAQWLTRPRFPQLAIAVTSQTSRTVEEALTDGRLDLNAATAQELDTLPGIGPVLSQRIVQLREERGGFSSKEELLDVEGIGEVTLEKIRPYLYLEGELEG